jgi:branched-chain amino acid transport system substrate-binding protein
MLHRHRRAAALALLLVVASGPRDAAAQSAPLEIPVLLPLTGFAAFIGQAQVKSLDIIERLVNAKGGIKGRPVKFVVQDTQTNPAVAVQLANALLAKKAPLIFGPGFTSECFAVAPLIKNAAVEYCLSPAILPPAGSTIYSAGLDAREYPVLLLRYFNAKHYTKVALISSTDSAGQVFDQYFDQALTRPEFKGLQLVSREHFGISDLSVNAQISRMKAANPDVAIEWTAGTAFATLLRSTQEIGLNVPIAGGTGNTTYEQMKQYAAFLPKTLIFPSTSPVTPGGVGPGPIRDAQTAYFNAFKAVGLKADFLNSQIWDPAWIVIDAYRALGPDATAAQLQSYIQQLHGWVGITGVYDFRDGSQRGVGIGAGVIAQWDAAKGDFVAASALGGRPK